MNHYISFFTFFLIFSPLFSSISISNYTLPISSSVWDVEVGYGGTFAAISQDRVIWYASDGSEIYNGSINSDGRDPKFSKLSQYVMTVRDASTGEIGIMTKDTLGFFVWFPTESFNADYYGTAVVVGNSLTMIKDNSHNSTSLNSTFLEIPQSAVVIPSDLAGSVQIILESSEDMVNWNTSNPGTYGSSTNERFFRVRAVQGND